MSALILCGKIKSRRTFCDNFLWWQNCILYTVSYGSLRLRALSANYFLDSLGIIGRSSSGSGGLLWLSKLLACSLAEPDMTLCTLFIFRLGRSFLVRMVHPVLYHWGVLLLGWSWIDGLLFSVASFLVSFLVCGGLRMRLLDCSVKIDTVHSLNVFLVKIEVVLAGLAVRKWLGMVLWLQNALWFDHLFGGSLLLQSVVGLLNLALEQLLLQVLASTFLLADRKDLALTL